jgi:pSer/pThr/pTyr-binding forkhead associated (FHA) protein
VSHVYCPECGFQNPEAANFCARCGSLLVREEVDEQTLTISPDQVEDEVADTLAELGVEGPALVVRSGGGRAGEHFALERDEISIGRSPDCDIFLDDVTVSRRHAILRRRDRAHEIEDLGSLNGTFVNRKRVERALLEDGDELQVGKYRMTYFASHEHH